MQLQELIKLLDRTPVIADIEPVSLCYLPEDIAVLDSANELIWRLDSPDPVLPARYLITSPSVLSSGRFPHVHCEHHPLSPALNDILPTGFERLAQIMLRQSQIAEHIVSDSKEVELVVLVLIDGLSYDDITAWELLERNRVFLQPVLVDVPTLTRAAFPNLINVPPIAERLFHMGFHRRIGFSYWSRKDNQLTNRLFRSIGEVKKVGDFAQIIALTRQIVGEEQDSRVYIQIMRSGLDGYAHSQKRRPPLEAVTNSIQSEFVNLIDGISRECSRSGVRANVYLTSDHGILWTKDFDPVVIGNAPSKANPRYSSWRNLHYQAEQGHRFEVDGQELYCLPYPKVRRNLRIDEQGVHGGISYQESIVPFVGVKVVP